MPAIRAFSLRRFFEGARVEIDIAMDLGEVENDGADAGVECFEFEAVGESKSVGSAFVGKGLEGGGAFLGHGLVNEEAQTISKDLGALVARNLQDKVLDGRANVGVLAGCDFFLHSNRKAHWPDLASFALAPFGPALLASLAFTPLAKRRELRLH
jgi:hypothetical protein